MKVIMNKKTLRCITSKNIDSIQMDESAEQKLQRIKDQNKARSKKYYEAHKEEIAQRRKENRIKINKIVEEAQPKLPPAQAKKKELKMQTAADVIKSLEEIDVDNDNKTNINNTKQLIHILDITDINKAFNDSKKVIQKIENATLKRDPTKFYTTNSKKGLYQTLLYLLDTFDIIIPEKSRNAYEDKHGIYKVQSHMDNEEDKKEEVMSWNEYLDSVAEEYGKESKQYIIASLYKLSGFRDNLQLKIISNENESADNKINYIIVPGPITDKRKRYTLILNVYKTDKKYKSDTIKLTKELSNLIRKYMEANDIGYGQYLFGKSLLSGYISKFNQKLGLHITINKYRKMVVSNAHAENPNMTAEDRVKLAYKMKHAPQTTEHYLHGVKQ